MKYEIDYIEFWAAGHCNLNCKGCSSCSPLSEPWYLDSKEIERDLTRLRQLNIDIHNITVLGGEPLLHPRITTIMDSINHVYPQARIGIITNGLLLLQMNDLFWKACVRYDVKFSVTCFPILNDEKIRAIENKLNELCLEYRITKKRKFNKILTQNHSDDINKVIEACGCNQAYNLKKGKISRCTVPMLMPLLNKVFHAGMIEDGLFDIYAAQSGQEIVEFLSKPNEACRNCSSSPIKVEWERAGEHPQLSDWVI